MQLTEGQCDVIALLVDGLSLAEIEDLCASDVEALTAEIVAILEQTGSSSVEDLRDLADTYGLEMFSATRH